MLSDPNTPGTGQNLDGESLPLRHTPVRPRRALLGCVCLGGGRKGNYS